MNWASFERIAHSKTAMAGQWVSLIVAEFPLENARSAAHIRGMRTRLPILLSAALLAAAILLVFRNELHARGPSETQCGFWGEMSAGMSCQ
jgi:hypothetical protein